MSEFLQVLAQIVKFRDERNWKQFHSPKNLAAAIAIEASELQEIMLWKTDEDVEQASQNNEQRQKMSEEIADVLIFGLLFCDALGIDPIRAMSDKLSQNERKYPAELSRNKSTKYTELG